MLQTHLFIISALWLSIQSHVIAEPKAALPMVYDPKFKKYFIGGYSKFLLRQDKGSLIERVEVSLDGKDYQPYSDAIQFKEEGKHTIKFRAVNSVNTWSPVQFLEVFVDLTPPSTEAKFSGDNFYKDSSGTLYAGLNAQISLVAQDNLSGVATIESSWDGNNFKPYDSPILIRKTGKQTLYFRTVDRVGNVESTKSLEFIADGTSPNSNLTVQGQTRNMLINGKNYTVVSDSVSFKIDAVDDGAKVRQIWVSLDEQPAIPYIKPIYFLEEGPHNLKYFSEDHVGNKEESKGFSVFTVSVPPKTVATASGKIVNTGGINFATREFQLKLEAKDNVVGLDRIEVKLDSEKEFKTYLEPIFFKTSGLHTVSYRSVDRVNNVEPAKTYTVHIYETAPETSLATAQPLVVREGTNYSPAPNVVTLNVGNSAVGVSQTSYSINDSPFRPYTGPITFTNDQKVYKLSYKSIDRLGNEETLKTTVIQMIGAIPVVDLFISNGHTTEEQVRTNYFEQGGSRGDARDTASEEGSPKVEKTKSIHKKNESPSVTPLQ
jgi:hypothetical protein